MKTTSWTLKYGGKVVCILNPSRSSLSGCKLAVAMFPCEDIIGGYQVGGCLLPEQVSLGSGNPSFPKSLRPQGIMTL